MIDFTHRTPFDCYNYILTSEVDSGFGSCYSTNKLGFVPNEEKEVTSTEHTKKKNRSGKRKTTKVITKTNLKTLTNKSNIKARERYWTIKAKKLIKEGGFRITTERISKFVEVFRTNYYTNLIVEKHIKT